MVVAVARNGPKFTALWEGDISEYESASEADLALNGILAFWCRGAHRKRVGASLEETLFPSSGN